MVTEKTEEFLAKLKASGHWNEEECDYSKVNFIGWHSPVVVINKTYGSEHLVHPTLLRYNRTKLGLKNAVDPTSLVKQMFREIHGDEFDYSQFVYTGYKGKGKVLCIKEGHGVFMVNPSNHLLGKKCPKCAGGGTYDWEWVKRQFYNVHGNRYDYSEFDYKGDAIRGKVRCQIHGFFWINPSNHKLGKGCAKCAKKHKPNTEEFKEQSRLIHGDTYDYDQSEYIDARTPLIIVCKKHGPFPQSPTAHKRGQGCPICANGFIKPYVLSLLNDLSESDLLHMSPFELFTIIKQGKLPKEFKKLMGTMEGTQERVTSLKELKQQYEEEREDQQQEEGDVLTHIINDVDDEITKLEETRTRLPAVNPINAIRSLDRSIYAGMDETAIESLVQFRLRELWNAVLRNETTVEAIQKETGGTYFTTIKSLFLDEHKKVTAIRPNKGYASHAPNMMQKLTVHRLLTNKFYGNWSGTGAGKTLSFILSSRKLDARLTVVIALNDAIEQAKRDITTAYPDSACHTEYKEGRVFDRKKHNYLILNYEKFQQNDSERLFQSLTKHNQIDFIVLDEVHHAKQREEQQESIRRAVMTRLLERAREDNPELHVLAMSATPVINSLYEAKSLLTLMTGLDYNDLDTRTGVDNALDVFKELTLKGIRFIPKYDIDMNVLTGQHMSNLNIDGRHLLDVVVAVKPKTYVDVEKILLPDKLKAITPYLKKGTVVYSYYTDGIIQETVRHIRTCGFKVVTYTGNEDQSVRQKSLSDFIAGRVDILVGSKPIGTSVDGLQNICDRLIPLTLPWTDAEFTQLKGRVYRQGSKFKTVDVIIPQVRIGLEGDEFWSWDIQRYNLITRKKTLADVAVDGAIPSAIIPSAETLFKKGKQSLEAWKQRVASGEVIEHVRQRVQFDLYPDVDDEQERKRRATSELTEFNRLGKITKSNKMHKRFKSDPNSWHRYHKLRRENMEAWDELPYEYIATKIKHNDDVVADFGCGENLMMKCIPNNKVHAFDHVAIDDSVVSCDMKNTGLPAQSVDIAVFSLSLWGSNWLDYIKEARRVLSKRGCMYIAEPLSTYETDEKRERLVDVIEKMGFQRVGNIELRGKFIYLTLIKH